MPGSLPPPSSTPLICLPAMSLDLETTGLDVRNDRIVQIAAVALSGGQILDTPRLVQLIDPRMAIPPASTRIHGFADTDVTGKPTFADFAPSLLEMLSGHVVVGHHIAYDMAILRHEAARAGVPWFDPPTLDLGQLVGALDRTLPDLGLETVAAHFGVAIGKRHDALGDAMAVAECFQKLIPVLRGADIRTFGEALALAMQRQDLLQRETQAGWHAQPGDAVGVTREAPVRIDGFVFSRRLRDVMSAPPVFVPTETLLVDAAKVMCEKRIGALLVGDPAKPPAGILTERDLLRAVADGRARALETTVDQMMTGPVIGMAPDDLLYQALGRMDAKGIRHLCVVDRKGIVEGMISQRDLLHHRARASTVIDDAIYEATGPAELAMAFSRVPQVAQGLLAEGLPGPDIARVVSREIRSLSKSAADLAARSMLEDGLGEAPAHWSLIILGSVGRGESMLGADQDNAIIHAGTDADDAWFRELGTRIAQHLDDAGIPFCQGGVMAKNPEWRATVGGWRDRVEQWLQRANPEDLLSIDIFFDLRPVAGDLELGNVLIEDAVAAASKSRPFLGLLAESVEHYAPRFGMFGSLRTEDGREDLKRDGLLPMVSFARAIGLASGSLARATPERLRDAARAGRIGERDAETLIKAHRHLMTLILRQQLSDIREGKRPSNKVEIGMLNKDDKRQLKESLHKLADIVGDVRSFMSNR